MSGQLEAAVLLEWSGAITGALGALLLALRLRVSGWGWALFLVSNVLWIGYGLLSGRWSIVFMQVFMTATSMLGIYRWIILGEKKPA